MEDPAGFIRGFRRGVVLDAPAGTEHWADHIREWVREDPRPGKLVIVESGEPVADFLHWYAFAEYMATATLLPPTYGELKVAGLAPRSVEEALFAGSYAMVHADGIDPRSWADAMIRRYVLDRSGPRIRREDPGQTILFLRKCAAAIGRHENFSSLGLQTGVAHSTASARVHGLLRDFTACRLPADSMALRRRLVRTPKMYFLDTGLACRLLGIASPDELRFHPMRGALFESWVVSELLKARRNRGYVDDLRFWQDRTGHEVPLLVDASPVARSTGRQAAARKRVAARRWRTPRSRTFRVNGHPAGHLVPIDIQSGTTLLKEWNLRLQWWCDRAGQRAARPVLVYGGDTSADHLGVQAVAWKDLWRVAALQGRSIDESATEMVPSGNGLVEAGSRGAPDANQDSDGMRKSVFD
jgi:hypothetical protein